MIFRTEKRRLLGHLSRALESTRAFAGRGLECSAFAALNRGALAVFRPIRTSKGTVASQPLFCTAVVEPF